MLECLELAIRTQESYPSRHGDGEVVVATPDWEETHAKIMVNR